MRISALQIEQFRKFREPVEVAGLQPGLNILHGPNEAGKSTIAQAIRTVFLERHRAGGAAFQAAVTPRDEPSAAPRISVHFVLGDQDCMLDKQYLTRPHARLQVGADKYLDGDADDHLAQLLGFSLAPAGASRPGLHGIPGLLWIEQGTGAELREPVASAAGTLDERLKDVIGQISSSRGSGIAAQIDRQLAALRRGGKADPGPLARVTASLAQARERRDQLEQRSLDFSRLTDELARQLTELATLNEQQPWHQQQHRLDELRRQQATLQPREEALQADRNVLQAIERQIERLHQLDSEREEQLASYRSDGKRQVQVQADAEAAALAAQAAQQRLDAANHAYEAARQRNELARVARLRDGLEQGLGRDAAEQRRIEEKLGQLHELDLQQATLREQEAAGGIDAKAVQALELLDQARREAGIRRDAVATRIDFRLSGDASRLSSEQLSPLQDSHRISSPVTLRIAGVGEIDIIPGGSDVARLAADAARLDAELNSLTGELGVDSLAHARQKLQVSRERLGRLEQLEAQRIALLEGQEQAHWQEQLADVRGRQEQQRRQLAELPEPDGNPVDLATSEATLEGARRDVGEARSQLEAAGRQLTEARLAEQQLAARIEEAAQRLLGQPVREAAEARQRELREAIVRRDLKAAQVEQAERTLAKDNPDQIAADIQRYSQALASSQQQRRQLEDGVREARAQLAALGADGLDEKLAQARAEVAGQEQQLQRHQQREAALALLRDTLQHHQQESTRQLYTPLRERLLHYLQMLFPAQALDLDIDELRPVVMHRGGQSLDLDQYSHGTQEQLGVLARFAYADLLAQASQPTLLMLDDTLVHSDAGRREQMQRILFDAASRHQVLLFTCHPEHWRDAGAAAMVDVAALQARKTAAVSG